MTTSDKRCPVGEALDKLSTNHQREMTAILENGIASHVIAVWFERYRRVKISAESVTRHRKHYCSCPKGEGDGDS